MKKENNETGAFIGFVLLSSNRWDKQKFIDDCMADWGLALSDEDDDDTLDEDDDDTLVVTMGDAMLGVSLMPAPVPNGEAEHYASGNYMWDNAVEVVQSHRAHILVSVLGKDGALLDKGRLFTKLVASCLKQENAIAVYTDGAVFQPQFYRECASIMQQGKDALPILNWVWFGIYRTEELSGIYTYGMRKFGKEEMEVYTDHASLSDVRNFLLDIVAYVLDYDVTLKDGETIGFSEDQKLAITLSDAIALEGKSLKLEYPQ